MGYFKQKFRSVKKLPTWIYWLPARLMQLYVRTCFRVRVVDPNGYIGNAKGAVSVTWAQPAHVLRRCWFPAGARKRTVAVVSSFARRAYIADFISILGLKSLRGSSSKKGANAYRAGIKAVKEGYNVSFTPDGPRGPRYVMKTGRSPWRRSPAPRLRSRSTLALLVGPELGRVPDSEAVLDPHADSRRHGS